MKSLWKIISKVLSSSEMSAEAPLEFLKTQAIIAAVGLCDARKKENRADESASK